MKNKTEKTEFCKGPFDNQVGGDHYQNGDIPGPAEWCMRQKLGPGESSGIKYLARHRQKGGLEDIKKARQYCEFVAWVTYGVDLREREKAPVAPNDFGDFVEKTIGTMAMNMGMADLSDPMDRVKTFTDYVEEQKEWALETFGPGDDISGLLEHIKKEVKEIEQAPQDVEEWIDIIILAIEGAWRSGAKPWFIEQTLEHKLEKNRARKWPDLDSIKAGEPIEHLKDGEPCGHHGCLNHITHPCEGCGRIAGGKG